MRHFVPLVFVAAIAVAVNAAYAIRAFESPPHEEWLYYVALGIPAPVAAAHNETTVASRLASAGYVVTIHTFPEGTALQAVPAADPNFQAWFGGLGREEPGGITVDILCTVQYPRSICPGDPEPLLRSQMADIVRESGLPLDPNQAMFGDYDLAEIGEFFTYLGHMCLVLITALVLGPTIAYTVKRHVALRDARRSASGRPSPSPHEPPGGRGP